MILYAIMNLAFLLYHIVLIDFSEKLYTAKPNKFITRLITFVVNSVILALCYFFRPHDAVIMVAFVASVYIECAIIYKERFIKNLFIGISFALNLFAVRLLVKCIIALIRGVHLYSVTQNIFYDMLSTTIALIFCSAYIKLLVCNVSEKNASIMRSNKNNLLNSSITITLIYAFLIFNTTNLYIQEEYPLFLALQFKIAISAMIGYFASIVYAFIHSKSMLYKTQSYEMQDKIALQDKENQKLRYIAYRDETLACYNRTFGVEALDRSLLQNDDTFTVAYFDLDGLKLVNDKFGHSEGDVYIKNVANILNNTFKRFNVCRMGGDEFMIIMPHCDNFNAQRYCLQAYEAVEMLCKMNAHNYNMSISYGIVEINAKQKIHSSEVLETVDKRMYEFKRNNKAVRMH